jgi:CRISPR-associated protein (TIGR02584 family)
MHILAAIGPNPASITELLWRLGSQPKASPLTVHLVLESKRSEVYLPEMLAPGAALDQLRERLGAVIPTSDELLMYRAETGDGMPEDEHAQALPTALTEVLWSAARAAQHGAGEEPVVFALSGGRRRASTALQSVVFQLLARPQDRLVDVRLSDPIAEGGTGFFFPAQARQELEGRHRYAGQPFLAREIAVLLEPIEVPRLRPLLLPEDLRTFADAKIASERQIQASAPPRLCLDLRAGHLFVNDQRWKLPGGPFVLYACLLLAVMDGDPHIWSRDEARIRTFFQSLSPRAGWAHTVKGAAFEQLRDTDAELDPAVLDLLSNTWTKLRKRLHGLADALPPVARLALIPQKIIRTDDGVNATFWTLCIPPSCVDVQGL